MTHHEKEYSFSDLLRLTKRQRLQELLLALKTRLARPSPQPLTHTVGVHPHVRARVFSEPSLYGPSHISTNLSDTRLFFWPDSVRFRQYVCCPLVNTPTIMSAIYTPIGTLFTLLTKPYDTSPQRPHLPLPGQDVATSSGPAA